MATGLACSFIFDGKLRCSNSIINCELSNFVERNKCGAAQGTYWNMNVRSMKGEIYRLQVHHIIELNHRDPLYVFAVDDIIISSSLSRLFFPYSISHFSVFGTQQQQKQQRKNAKRKPLHNRAVADHFWLTHLMAMEDAWTGEQWWPRLNLMSCRRRVYNEHWTVVYGRVYYVCTFCLRSQ